MADYFTSLSCMFDVGAADNIARALAIYEELAADLDHDEGAMIGFAAQADPASGPSSLWLYSEHHGEPEHVIAFVLRCAEAFNLKGVWGFMWALTCSKPRLDGYGGGAQVVDLGRRTAGEWVDCDHWLATQLAADGGGTSDPEPPSRDAIRAAVLALPEDERRLLVLDIAGDIGWHPLCVLDEAAVRDEAQALIKDREAGGVAIPEAVTDDDLRAGCASVARHTDLSEAFGSARFAVAQTAIGLAEKRRTGAT